MDERLKHNTLSTKLNELWGSYSIKYLTHETLSYKEPLNGGWEVTEGPF